MCEQFDSFSKFIRGKESQDPPPHPAPFATAADCSARSPCSRYMGATPLQEPRRGPAAPKSEAKSCLCLRRTGARRRARDFAGDGARLGRPVPAPIRSEVCGGQGQRRGGRLRPGSAEGRLSQGREEGQTGGQRTLGRVREDPRADGGSTTPRPQTAGPDSNITGRSSGGRGAGAAGRAGTEANARRPLRGPLVRILAQLETGSGVNFEWTPRACRAVLSRARAPRLGEDPACLIETSSGSCLTRPRERSLYAVRGPRIPGEHQILSWARACHENK